jgi:transcriptional regulator with XRE-family HTH domain
VDDTWSLPPRLGYEESAMEAENGAALPLARRLRDLREHHWPDVHLTQAHLARALSVAPATLSSWESKGNPKAPPKERLKDYARFFATRESVNGRAHLPPLDTLTDDEKRLVQVLEDELIGLHPSSRDRDTAAEGRRTLLAFNATGRVVIICPQAPKDAVGPLAAENHINYTRLHNYADLDALVELFGHLRAFNPEADVCHRLPSEAQQADFQTDLILLGGIGWNSATGRILAHLKRLPIEQVAVEGLATGEVFRVNGGGGREPQVYFPQMDNVNGTTELVEDLAFIARLRNPFNSSRTLTIFNGVHSRGVVGAVLALTDKALGPGNEDYLAQANSGHEFAILVKVPIVSGRALAPDLRNPEMRLFEWSDS